MSTAIKRVKASSPASHIHSLGLILPPALDYGCGYGMDADTYGMDRYDPEHFPDQPRKRYHTILCTYVLNSLPLAVDCQQVLDHIHDLLHDEGIAYISVRRDLTKMVGRTERGYQHVVILDLPTLSIKPKRYAIYRMDKSDTPEILMFGPCPKKG